MTLDIMTLMAAGAFLAALSAIFLAGAWTQLRGTRALAWWAASQFTIAAGMALLVVGLLDEVVPLIALGGVLTSTSGAVALAGARSFNGRKAGFRLVFIVLAINLAGSGLAAFGLVNGPPVVNFSVATLCLVAAAFETWRGRADALPARWPVMGLFLLHASVFVAGVLDVLTGRINLPNELPPLTSGFGLIHFETAVYSLGIAVFMVALARERSERGYMVAARTDPLTGLANRGAFFTRAERLLVRCQLEEEPLSVIVFDLDHFKEINDTHGHAAGDRVLRIFADVVVAILRPNDLAGRYGGEEFGVVLPAATLDTAYLIADRIRHAFRQACGDVDEFVGESTVSGGVAQAWPGAYFRDVVEAADQALYRAKRAGRDRVERAEERPSDAVGAIHVA